MENLQVDKYDLIISKTIELSSAYLPRFVISIFILVVGLFVIKSFTNLLRTTLKNRNFDPNLTPFLVTITSVLLKVVLIISVASMLGIETTSFVAVLGAAGLAIGLALQGSLSNFAGGVLLLVLKPYRVDDVVEFQGFLGKIKEIRIFNTIITTFDNRRVIIPNGAIANGSIINFSAEPTRRVEAIFSISYSDSIPKAKGIIQEIIDADERILREPIAPFMAVRELGESSVDLVVRVWCQSADFWPIYFDLIEKVKIAFDENGITIPFPQRDVHLFQDKKQTLKVQPN
jgi:small conductance mechanosensitive channel